ncbi:probable serine/threonine-protein kinase DDB_G0275165 [Anastrepha obliqua]|uniref:probable serine/threonine-protein kinase DDB_G0275165 n=1 Tax=Anastrepha obliqua TaxID=95512 RepID=UPI00240A288F|nr:probable serine/threonine-protein kinase DDB_G0275165 [Anastrepha obliqua]
MVDRGSAPYHGKVMVIPRAALLTSTTKTTTTATASATTATLALATLTTNTSTTTTTSAVTTTVSSATNAKSIMCTTLKTSIAEQPNNSNKSQTPKRLRSSPEKAEINASKKTGKLSSKQQQLTYWLSKPPSENRFDILDQENELEENELEENETEETQTLNSITTKPKYVPKQPPIYVQKVQVLGTLIKALNECIQNNYELKVLKNNETKIQTKESTHYSATIKLLKERNTQYYTFRPKEEKGFKVILRNMHHSTDINDIKSELTEYGHDVTNIFNILKSDSKQPIPLFPLEIKTNSNSKDIYIQYNKSIAL